MFAKDDVWCQHDNTLVVVCIRQTTQLRPITSNVTKEQERKQMESFCQSFQCGSWHFFSCSDKVYGNHGRRVRNSDARPRFWLEVGSAALQLIFHFTIEQFFLGK